MKVLDLTQRRIGQLSSFTLFSVLVNLILVGGVVYLTAFQTTGEKANNPTTTPTPAGSRVQAFGSIQPTTGVISVFGPPGDQIVEFFYDKGVSVTAGNKLLTLKSEATLALNLQALEAQIKEAEALQASILASKAASEAELEATAKQAEAGIAQDQAAIEAKVAATVANKNQALREKERLQSAMASGVNISPQELEKIDLLIAQADAELKASQAQKEKILAVQEQSKQSLVAKKNAIIAETNRALAQVPLQSLQVNKQIALTKIEQAQLTSPVDGQVIKRMANVGDSIANMPLMQIADTSRMSVIAEVYETDVGTLREAVRKGPVPVRIEARALGEEAMKGTLSNIDQIGTIVSKNVYTPLGPREDADRRVVEVRVELDSRSAEIAKNFIAIQVNVIFEVQKP